MGAPKLSKLAMLAKGRTAAASSSAAPARPASKGATPPADKPLSKLQAKMLAARQVKANAGGASPSPGGVKTAGADPRSPVQGAELEEDPMLAATAAASDALFSASSTGPPPLNTHRPSAFATLLVSPKRSEAPAELVFASTDLAHAETLAGFADVGDTLEDLRRAFETLSPDDIVAEKRKGTAVGSRLAEGPVVATGGAGGKGRK